jgi:starch synthase
MNRKKVLLVSQELDPYLVLTEIGNVVKKIAPFVHDNGLEVRVLMPKFGVINERRNRLHEVVRLSGINIIINDEDHPLIIKVASLPGARIQIYFLDNEDFFKRKQVFRDDNEVYFEDNVERMVFFSKGVLETVKKFGWSPDIMHLHGWMTSLIPMYLKTVYAKDPVFDKTKTVFSLYGEEFSEKLDSSFLIKAKISEDIPDEAMEQLSGLDHLSLNKSAVTYADGIVWAIPNASQNSELEEYAKGKVELVISEDIDIAPTYLEYYNKLLSE